MAQRPCGQRRVDRVRPIALGVEMFYSWCEVKFWFFPVAAFALGIAIFRGTRTTRVMVGAPAQITGVLTSLLSFVLMSFVLLGHVLGCSSHLEPLLSPSGAKAARIEIHDEGGTGGGYGVAVYSHHGFHVQRVMSGAWRSVEQNDVRWIGNSKLEVRYTGSESNCVDTRDVHVICVQKPTKSR